MVQLLTSIVRSYRLSCTTVCALAISVACHSAPQEVPTYEVDAAGEKAAISQVWTLSAPGAPPIGPASSGSICDDRLYLADPRQSVVHEISLTDGIRRRALAHGMASGLAVSAPETVVADCRGDRLVVSDRRDVVVFGLGSGSFRSRLPKPEGLGPALGIGLLHDDALVLPAYVMPDLGSWLQHGPSTALRDAALGLSVPLDGSPPSAVLTARLNDGCRSMSFDCLRMSIDRLDFPGEPWLACQADSHLAGIFAEDGSLVRRIDVKSHLFLDNGETTDMEAPIPEKIAWSQANSTIHACMGFGPFIATIHTTPAAGEWAPGKAMTPVVRMNVHRVGGQPLVADLTLSDLPVARDKHSLYVLRYDGARLNNDSVRLTLERIRILNADGGLASLMEGP